MEATWKVVVSADKRPTKKLNNYIIEKSKSTL